MDQELLKKLGLSPYETKCYVTLVKHSTLSSKDIAKLSGVPPTSVYRNLETLQQKGLIKVLQKEPLTYQAPEPKILLQNYAEQKKKELIDNTEKTISYLESIKKTGQINPQIDIVNIFAGKKQSYDLGMRLIKSAKEEMLLLGKGEKPGIYELARGLENAKKKGVKLKFITTAYEENKDVYNKLKKAGIKVKSLNVNMTLLVKDKKESQVVLKTPQLKEERIVLHITDKEYSEANREYFLTLWKKATPI